MGCRERSLSHSPRAFARARFAQRQRAARLCKAGRIADGSKVVERRHQGPGAGAAVVPRVRAVQAEYQVLRREAERAVGVCRLSLRESMRLLRWTYRRRRVPLGAITR